MLNMPYELLKSLFDVIGARMNQKEFVVKMRDFPTLLHSAHDGPTKGNYIQLLIAGAGFKGIAEFDKSTDKLHSFQLQLQPLFFDEMKKHAKVFSGKNAFHIGTFKWESGFFSPTAKLSVIGSTLQATFSKPTEMVITW
jgi:hypothetical protein